MDPDTLTTKNALVPEGSACPDSVTFLFKDWRYSDNTATLDTKFWLQDSILLFHERNAPYYKRHDGLIRTDKFMSESLLFFLLLFEALFVAYLIKNGLKFIHQSVKNAVNIDENNPSPTEYFSKVSHIRRFLWWLSMAIFALIVPILLALHGTQPITYHIDFQAFISYMLYTTVYFCLKNSIYRIIGKTFHTPTQTKQWINTHKTALSFYALSLTPVLIGVEIGIEIEKNVLISWILGFLIASKLWMTIKAINIFSIRFEYLLYFILYLCALEIMPVFLFYRGLFML